MGCANSSLETVEKLRGRASGPEYLDLRRVKWDQANGRFYLEGKVRDNGNVFSKNDQGRPNVAAERDGEKQHIISISSRREEVVCREKKKSKGMGWRASGRGIPQARKVVMTDDRWQRLMHPWQRHLPPRKRSWKEGSTSQTKKGGQLKKDEKSSEGTKVVKLVEHYSSAASQSGDSNSMNQNVSARSLNLLKSPDSTSRPDVDMIESLPLKIHHKDVAGKILYGTGCSEHSGYIPLSKGAASTDYVLSTVPANNLQIGGKEDNTDIISNSEETLSPDGCSDDDEMWTWTPGTYNGKKDKTEEVDPANESDSDVTAEDDAALEWEWEPNVIQNRIHEDNEKVKGIEGIDVSLQKLGKAVDDKQYPVIDFTDEIVELEPISLATVSPRQNDSGLLHGTINKIHSLHRTERQTLILAIDVEKTRQRACLMKRRRDGFHSDGNNLLGHRHISVPQAQ